MTGLELGLPYNTMDMEGAGISTEGWPVLELGQRTASPPSMQEEVGEIVFPHLQGLLAALGEGGVAVVLPAAFVAEPEQQGRGVVLFTAMPGVAPEWWRAALSRAAATVVRAVALADGNPAPVVLQREGPGESGTGTSRAMSWPLPWNGGDPAALVVVADDAEDRLEGLAATLDRVAAAVSAGLRVVHGQHRRARATRVLLEVATTIGSTLQLEEVLSLVTEQTARLVGADRCLLWLLGKDGRTLLPSALYGMPADFVADWKRRPLSLETEPLSREAIQLEKVVLVSDAPNDPRTDKDAVQFFSDKTILVLPLVARGQMQGTLFINHIHFHHPYSRAEIETAVAIANQAGIAIQNAKLYREVERQRRDLLASFHRIGDALATGLDLKQTLQIVADLAAEIVCAEACAILLLGETDGQLVFMASKGLPEDVNHAGCNLCSEVVEQAAPRLVSDLWAEGQPCWIQRSELERLRSYLGVPLLLRGKPVGVISIFGERPGQFGQDEVELLSSFAHQAAIAIDNAVLYQAADRERNELAAIISSISDAVVIVDEEGLVARINSAAEVLTGWSAEDAVGHPSEKVLVGHAPLGPSRPRGGNSPWEGIRKRQPTPYFEGVVVSRDGTERDVVASFSVVHPGVGGKGLGVLIARDVSSVREVERMKVEFVSMVSHELRTPVGLLKGYTSTLLNPLLTLDQETVQRFLRGIDGAAGRLGRLIEDLLNFSRIEAGLLRPSIQPTDLVSLLSGVVSGARAASKSHEILLELPEGPVEAEVDRVQMELVVDNLLGNALKYTPAGKEIQVTLGAGAAEAEVRVADQGIGIAAQDLPRIFDKFYRVGGEYAKRAPGTGLGLYICRNIVEAHGGRLWARSKLGEGSIFAFALPLVHQEAARSGQDARAVELGGASHE